MSKHGMKKKGRSSGGFLSFVRDDKENYLDEFPYCRRIDFLSGEELIFFKVLSKAVGNRYVVCPRVRLRDIFFVKCGDIDEMNKYLDKIASEYVDFMLCRIDDMFPVCGIDVYDKSQNSKGKKNRDIFLEDLFDKTGVALVRFPAKNAYMISEVRQKIEMSILTNKVDNSIENRDIEVNIDKIVNKSEANKEANKNDFKLENLNDSEIDAGELTVVKEDEKDIKNNSSENNDKNKPKKSAKGRSRKNKAPLCPKCGRPMRLKEAKRGPRKGQKYYCCSAYPSCNEVFLLKQE